MRMSLIPTTIKAHRCICRGHRVLNKFESGARVMDTAPEELLPISSDGA